ncbi:RNA-dependent RNA polymerase P1 [Cereal yellow dwarf virus RPS]|uniref:RNA-dependent RNA polymerase P1 n=1 Tax=Cereal yellow dwarf virus RPS TaxID=228582 RepID=Q9IZF6_9VIRU|nr:RNA-dependent RNA polymerase P1 [Cereal yellow dwarf virus RPS]AAF62531.1 RNA-dependent RNA polymerase P1 [Cereal yellow dwarf virus RPS]
MGPKKLSFSVFLWLMCFLSFSQGNHTGMATGSDFPSPTTLIYSGGVWPLVTPHSSPVAGEKCTLTCAPCPVRSITEPSYKELLQQLWVKAWLDSRALCFTAIDSSSRFLSHAYELSSATARALFGQVLWFAVYLWTNVLLQTARIVCSVVASYYLQVASLISLGITTSWIYKILRWTFGTLPASLCIRLGKSICRVLTCRKFFNEKSVAGFDSYSIPQSPPKKSVITLRRADKTHVGFAVCIRLFNNSNALVTSEHNLREADAFYSPRTGRAIKLAEFKVIFKDADLDVAIVAGPDNWESAFGCGSVHFTTHDRLAKCPAQIYVIDGEDWRAHSAKVVGHFDNFAQVLSNTKPGFSGAGYFHGKTLLGVHKGHAGKDYNFNLMAPLPAIPGLTSPKYEIESDPPQGLIFPSEVAEEITKTIQSVYNDFLKLDKSIHSKGKEWKGGVAWADLEDESGKSGNAKAAASAVPTAAPKAKAVISATKKVAAPSSQKEPPRQGASQPTPTTSTTTPCSPVAIATSPDTSVPSGMSQQDVMQNLMSLLVQRIDMSKIEKSIIDQVAAQALKKPRGKRGSNKKRAPGNSTSPMSTPGRYLPPNKRSQGSKGLENSPPSTIPVPDQQQPGGSVSAPNTRSWVRKQKVSGGPPLAPPQN